MAVLWLALCLTPVSCLLHTDGDADPPIRNLRMDPETRRLSWDLSGNVSEIWCFINSKQFNKAVDNRYCQFYVLPFCEAKNFSVGSTRDPPFSVGLRYPSPEGDPAAAAQRLGCWVHDVDFLTCGWEVGAQAPGDVQYRLFWQNVRCGGALGPRRVPPPGCRTFQLEECPRYGLDGRGTHVRCHFEGVSRLGPHVQFLVNSSSPGARMPCSELTVELAWIERLSAPNITAVCNRSSSFMEWEVSSHFSHRFEYELQIQKGADPPYTVKPPETYYALPNPGNYEARLRVRNFYRQVWSEWSAPQRFDCDLGDDRQFRDRLTSALIPLGALLSLGLGAALCGRYSLLRKLFPPIPHMKDPTGDNLQTSKLVAWEASRASQEDCQVAVVQVLGET